jgi:alpha-L-fucosidase
VDIVSKGGNYLLNVGPTAEGLIPQPCVDCLAEVGQWMDVNHEAIYGTMPWRVFHERAAGKDGAPGVEVRFTTKGDSLYATCLAWPDAEIAVKALGRAGTAGRKIKTVRMLGSGGEIRWRQDDDGLTLSVPKEQPCKHAFVYQIDWEPKHD